MTPILRCAAAQTRGSRSSAWSWSESWSLSEFLSGSWSESWSWTVSSHWHEHRSGCWAWYESVSWAEPEHTPPGRFDETAYQAMEFPGIWD